MNYYQGNPHNAVAAVDAAATPCCFQCKGPVRWNGTDNHADEANVELLCMKCGYYYRPPAYEGRCEEVLLYHYCFSRDWKKAAKRVVYAPKEADHVARYNNTTALHWAVYFDAPVDLIRALVQAVPKSVSPGSSYRYIGNPLWMAISWVPTEREIEIVKIIVGADNDVLLAVPDVVPHEVSMESLIGNFSRVSSTFLLKAADLPSDMSMESVLQYSEENAIDAGEIDIAFRMQSILVQADYHGTVCADDTVQLLHACAGCRDPFFEPAGLLLLAIRFFPKQLLETDANGSCPLHIAVSTVNRDKKEYFENPFADEEEKEWREEQFEKHYDDFMNGFCPHHHEVDFEDYLEDYKCKCEWEKNCYEWEKCNCYEKFKKGRDCDCDEKFLSYIASMNEEHRLDKQEMIHLLLKGCPQAAVRLDMNGNLPLHLAVKHGKQWDGGVRSLVQAFPDAVATRDPKHFLYPFQLAAIGDDLWTSFELLRTNVDVLPNAVKKQQRSAMVRAQRHPTIQDDEEDETQGVIDSGITWDKRSSQFFWMQATGELYK